MHPRASPRGGSAQPARWKSVASVPSKSAAPSWSSAESDRAAAQARGTASASPRRTSFSSSATVRCGGTRRCFGWSHPGGSPGSFARPAVFAICSSRSFARRLAAIVAASLALWSRQGFLSGFYSAGSWLPAPCRLSRPLDKGRSGCRKLPRAFHKGRRVMAVTSGG